MRFRITLAFILLTAFSAGAQSHLQKAQELWGKKDYNAAINLLQKHLRSADDYATLGGWLYGQGRFAEAAGIFGKALSATPNGSRKFTLPLARCLFRAGRYTEVLQALQSHASTPTGEAAKLLQSARWAAAQKPDTLLPQSLGLRINTSYPESFPQLSADGQKLYFTRRVKGIDEDLMRALPDSCGGWFTAGSLPYPVNSRRQERAQFISADGHYIFFGRDDIRSEDGWTGGGADLYMAYCTTPDDTLWTTPLPFGATINTPAYEGMPALSPDNSTLYFVSDRPGGLGGLDIWYSHFRRGRWQEPVNAGTAVNTSGNDISPFLSADGQYLFFASDGQMQNFGGYDLYRAQRTDTLWTQTENLGLPLNSVFDEISPAINVGGDSIYYATDRQLGGGNTDIWRGALPHSLQATAVRHVRGLVVDSLTQEPITNAWVYFTTGDTEAGNFRSNRGDGSFSAFLKKGQTYTFSIAETGYRPFTQAFTTAQNSLATADTLRLALLPQHYTVPRRDSLLLRLHFRRNELTLNDTMRTALAALPAYLTTEGSELLVWSFTDDSGTPMLNEEISTQRAQLISEALRRLGIPAEKMQLQGWGEAQPLLPNDNEVNRDQNRRVELILRR